MALFKKTTKKVSSAPVKKYTLDRDVLRSPRITEKASIASEHNAYTFNVTTTATKPEIKKAIMDKYNVVPVKITVTTIKPKAVFVRGKHGVKSGGKKAVVTLKKDDKIALV